MMAFIIDQIHGQKNIKFQKAITQNSNKFQKAIF